MDPGTDGLPDDAEVGVGEGAAVGQHAEPGPTGALPEAASLRPQAVADLGAPALPDPTPVDRNGRSGLINVSRRTGGNRRSDSRRRSSGGEAGRPRPEGLSLPVGAASIGTAVETAVPLLRRLVGINRQIEARLARERSATAIPVKGDFPRYGGSGSAARAADHGEASGRTEERR
jgi:hypothetical protein